MTIHQNLTFIGARDVEAALNGAEREIIDLVEDAYVRHSTGDSELPHSMFLRFPELERERIIALPGYLGGDEPTAGIKWIASFPDNVAQGMPRASALMILNSVKTGRPTAVLEGSLISAKRTAASAALGARLLHTKSRINRLGVIGCGLINSEIVRFITADRCPVDALSVFDLDRDRAQEFAIQVAESGFEGPISFARSCDQVLESCDVISFATTAVKPTVENLDLCPPDTTILHISLRDLKPDAILAADNIVDDVDHALRAATSTHLAEQQVGNREFVRGTIADVARGMAPRIEGKPSVYSPFGLGVLDLALAEFVRKKTVKTSRGMTCEGFLP